MLSLHDVLSDTSRPVLWMCVGVPASGKSTWVRDFTWTHDKCSYGAGVNRKLIVISTDNYIESLAKELGTTYDKIFKDEIEAATKCMEFQLIQSILHGYDIIIDQTNTSIKSRAKKLAAFPEWYRKYALFFPTPNKNLHGILLNQRSGKSIPTHIIENMKNNLQEPTHDEGFDDVFRMEFMLDTLSYNDQNFSLDYSYDE